MTIAWAFSVLLPLGSAVQRSPNATHKRNGRLTVTLRVVRFATNEFPKHFSPTPFYICDIETGPLVVHVVRRLILRLCLKILPPCTLKYDRRGLAALLLGYMSNFQAIGEFKISISRWLKINNTLWNCCFIVIFDHINIYGPPKCYMDHPAVQCRWSVGRPRIFEFGQHCLGERNRTLLTMSLKELMTVKIIKQPSWGYSLWPNMVIHV